jgi:hypothetical protein
MTTEDLARKNLTQQRQQDEHLQDMMLNRTEAELHSTGEGDAIAAEHARETLTQQRQQEEHVKENMLHRAEAEITQKA